ncbi:BlaR1 family beta-lactam sensor/signal transducer [Vallitalea sediminicola]
MLNFHIFAIHIFHSSIMISIVILIILSIKYFLKNRLGAMWHYSIWYILVLRMMLIESVETRFSIFNIYHYLLNVKNNNEIITKSIIGGVAENSRLLKQATNMSGDYAISMRESPLAFIYDEGTIIWLIGVIIISLIIISYNYYINLRLRRDNEIILDKDINMIVENCKLKMKVNKKLGVAQSDFFKTPILVGIFKPVLLFPKTILQDLTMKELEYIILHELAHYKRKDIVKNCIVVILQVMYWFNPLVSYAFYKMRQDCEVACDAYVLSHLKLEEYKDYGNTIITMIEKISFPTSVPGIVGFSNKKSNIKNRILRIAEFNKEKKATRIKKTIAFIIVAVILLSNGQQVLGREESELPINRIDQQFKKYFGEYDGTFVMLNENEDKYYIYNSSKAQKRVAPLSTFKIVIAIAALEEGVIKDGKSELKWDGTKYPFDIWNKDHTLNTSMVFSVNWYFDKLSRDIGKEKMTNLINNIDYGNRASWQGMKNITNGKSTLKISPIEQVILLKKIHNYEIPFKKENIDEVKEILKLSKRENAVLAGKTGTYIVNESSINGWFIGYVEKDDNVYYFAVNIDGDDNADGANARKIVLKILNDKGIY